MDCLKGLFKKYVTVEGEKGGLRDPRQTVTKICGWDGGSGLARYVTENKKILRLSIRTFNKFSVYSIKKASKYPIAIEVISSYTYIAIIMTYICACLPCKYLEKLSLHSSSNIFLLKSLRDGGGMGVKIYSALRSVT